MLKTTGSPEKLTSKKLVVSNNKFIGFGVSHSGNEQP